MKICYNTGVVQNYSRKYLAEFVYGATDGTVTTFAIISAVSGAALSPAIVLILGFSNVLADGFSMASSNYLSEKSDDDPHRNRKKSPFKTALVTFLSFVFVGSIPLLPFALFYHSETVNAFNVSVVATALAFLAIGYTRGHVMRKNTFRTALETLSIGALASVIAYAAGSLLEMFV